MPTRHPRFAERGVRRPGSCIWRAAASLAILLASAGSHAARSSLLATMSRADQQLSQTEVGALRGGANGHPYATLALLYLLRDTSSIQDGALYVESIPEAALTSLLLGSTDRDAISTLLGTLLWNPYSDGRFFVQVSWSVRPVTSGGKVIEFHTQLLIGPSAFRHPPLESDTAVLLRNGNVWFVAPAAKT
jgi:hypothetical protein